MKRSLILVPAVVAVLASPLAAFAEPTRDQMIEHMKQMRAQMEEIRRTSDPVKRDELVTAHMKSMQEGMQRMHGMDGGDGTKGSAMGGCMEMMHGMHGGSGQPAEGRKDPHGH